MPSALPKVWNIPHQPNPNFTGRDALLTDLRAALLSGHPAALTQAISGLGGVGKTQLAVQYAHRHASDYDLVWWVRSEEPSTLASDYANLAQQLDLPEKDAADQPAIVAAVRDYLARHPNWLLIFDNATTPPTLQDYLPQSHTGHILITSRNPNWKAVATPLPVPVLDKDPARSLILNRTNQNDKIAASNLAQELGYLPLALEQAAAYIDATHMPLATYLQLFQTRHKDLWGNEDHPLDYRDKIDTTWNLAIQQLPQPAIELLYLCAYLAPGDIPLSLLKDGKDHLPPSLSATLTDPLSLEQAIKDLRHYSLLERDSDTDAVSLHRLLQTVVRDSLSPEGQNLYAQAALTIVSEAFPYDMNDPDTWPESTRLLPHALASAEYTEKLRTASETTSYLLNEAGLYLKGRAQFDAARLVFERALTITGSDHRWSSTYINNLGMVLKDLGDLQGARAHLERALLIDEATYGPNHPIVATDVNNLGMVLQDLGDLQGARAHLERALLIGEATYGPNHPNVAIRVNNLGMVLKDLGDLQGARAHLERALLIDEATYGPNHPIVATDVNNLGMVLQDLGDLQGARAHLERALLIGEATYGPNHPNVAIRVNNLGMVLNELGDLQGARAHLERALLIGEATYGPNHPNVAIRVNNLGMVLQDLGDLQGARAHLERALQIFQQFLGDSHPNTITVKNNLKTLGEP